MDLTTREEIGAPPAAVWAALQDYNRFESAARDRGAKVTRGGSDASPTWNVVFPLRGTKREADLHLEEITPESRLVLAGQGSGIGGALTVTLEPLGPRRTAMVVAMSLKGKSLPGRVLLQGLKLAQGTAQDRFEKAVRKMGRRVAKAERANRDTA